MAVETSSFEPKPFGRYVLLDKLAVGGMAEIYKAKTYGVDGFEKQLAIKRILPHCAADKEFINMLVDEAKLTVLLSHANIVQVYDLGKVGEDYFISMEYINGTNLREVVHRVAQKGEKLPEEVAVYIMSEMCKGLDYAHRKTDSQGAPLNIVHRDISPQNILISFEGEVKIVDFGIAKAAMNVSHTMAGILKGKIAYMSPEQALGKPLDHRTDIFSAGVLLYEMLTGEKLFNGDTQFEVLNRIRTTRVNTMMLPEQLSAPLKVILTKALAYNPKDRYQSGGDFQLDLTKYLYSSYIDFSPRQLASLLVRLFESEMKRKETPTTIDDKTRSVLINQAREEDIMVHGATPHGATAVTQRTGISGVYALPGVKKFKLPLAAAAVVAVVSLAGYFGYQFFAKQPEPAPVKRPILAELGGFQVNSSPTGARIYLNGRDTGLATPANLERLALGEEYEIRLVKEKYQEASRTLALTTTTPVPVNETLTPLSLGLIEIASNPPGAAITVDGRETGLFTPNQITNLQVQKNYQLKLALAGHADWYSSVEVKNLEPIKLTAALTTLPAPPPLPVATPTAPPQPQKPPPAPTISYGKLEIRSDPPQAKILLNGKETGRVTPATLEKLESGKKVTIALNKEGYEGWKQSATIKADQINRLTAALEKKAVEPPAAPPPVPVEPVSTGGSASVKLESDPPGADVYLNAEFKGVTPLTVSNAPAGTVKLLVAKEGYLKHISSLNLKAGENRSLGTIQLEGLYGEVSINSTPPRADIYFDGELIAPKTPVTIRKVPRDRTHSVKLQLNGYRAWETSFDLKDGESKKYNVPLEKD